MTAVEEKFIEDVQREYDQATSIHGGFNSAHEGYAVILEELEELWNEVMQKRHLRDKVHMRKECVQIAAMAMKFAVTICER